MGNISVKAACCFVFAKVFHRKVLVNSIMFAVRKLSAMASSALASGLVESRQLHFLFISHCVLVYFFITSE
jgi:hypothetical protein